MRTNCHSIIKWSLLTGTSTILIKLCYESLFKTTLVSSMSTYGETLTAWASTGQRAEFQQNKSMNMKIRDDLQLIGAQIYFRHGARTPLNLLPGLEEVKLQKKDLIIFTRYSSRLGILQ